MRSCFRAAVLFALLAGFTFPSSSRAQLGTRTNSAGGLFEAGFGSATVDGYAGSSLIDLASSSFWGSTGRVSAATVASMARFESGSTTAYGELHGSMALSSNVRNLAAFKLDGGGGSYRSRISSHYIETSLLLGRSSGSGAAAAWLDLGVGAVGDMTSRNTAHAIIAGTVHFPSGAVDAALHVARVSSTRYADAVINARWAPFRNEPLEAARFIAGVDAGVRSTDDVFGRHAWLNGVASLRINGPVSLVAYAGAHPSDPMRATPGVTFTSIGLRVELGRSDRARPPAAVPALRATSVSTEVAGGHRVITIVLPQAKTVELMGDFTGWLPVVMTRSGSGAWQARVPVGQGSHRLNVRRDSGAWEPPPGLPSAADDFGGTVGILVVPR